MKKKIIVVLTALTIAFNLICISAFAVDPPVSYDDLTEDAIAIGNAYANAFGNALSNVQNGGALGFALGFADIPLSYYKFVTDLGWCISPVDDVYYYLVNGELYVDDTNQHNSSNSGHGGGGGRRRVSDDDLVTGKDFYKSIVTNNPSPIKYSGRLSYQSSMFSDTETRFAPNFYKQGIFGYQDDDMGEIYMLPFSYTAETDKYCYGIRQFHFFKEHGERDSTGYIPIYLCEQSSSIFDIDWSDKVTYTKSLLSDYPYVRIYFAHNSDFMWLSFFETYKMYLTNGSTGYTMNYALGENYSIQLYDLSDISLTTKSTFISKYQECDYAANNNDVGYLISDKPFIFTNQIDFSRIPDDVVIYPGADTIIDNPSDDKAGDTIYNYITNNYVFPDKPAEEPADDKDKDSSGAGGDITVSGKVEVDGSITIDTKPIDININVNNGGSGFSGTAEPYVEFDEDLSISNFFDWLLVQTSGFREFMGVIFGFMPAQIVSLLCAGFASVILARFVGR